MENGRKCWTISSEVPDPSNSSVNAQAADVAMIKMEEAHLLMSFLFIRSSTCTIML